MRRLRAERAARATPEQDVGVAGRDRPREPDALAPTRAAAPTGRPGVCAGGRHRDAPGHAMDAGGRVPPRLRVLFVGAFPERGRSVIGGNATDCQVLLQSSLPDRVEITALDSSQEVPAPPLAVRVSRAARRLLRFLYLFERSRPDVTLIFASSGLSFIEKSIYALYSRIRRVPAVLSVRSGHFMDLVRRSRAFRSLAQRMLRAPRVLLCQGRRWQEFFRDELRVPESRCVVLEGWVVTDEYLRIGERRRVRAAGVELLFMGWLEEFKGVFDLLEALTILARDPALPPVRLRLCGDGSARREIERRLQAHGIADRVVLAGWVTGAAKLEAFEGADIFVLPSHTEGLPNAMLEAMGAGLPVVVTPVGSIPDVIESGRNGVLVEPRNPGALAEVIRQLVLRPELRARLGRSAHRVARERFAVEPAVDRLVALLSSARGASTRGTRGTETTTVESADVC